MFFSKVVQETWSLITPFIDDILDELYDHALAHETTAKMFAGHNIEGQKNRSEIALGTDVQKRV